MFGNRSAAFVKRLKKQGKPALGTVTSVTAKNELEQQLGRELRLMPHPYNVVISFRTELGRQEKLVLHTSDISGYAVGFGVPVLYYYERGVCFAAPESIANKDKKDH